MRKMFLNFITLCVIVSYVDGQNITGNGTAGYLPRFSTTTTLMNSIIFQNTTNNNIGINITAPAVPLHVRANNSTNDGLRVDQLGTSASVLSLSKLGSGGVRWDLMSTGSLNPEGVGYFIIKDNTAVQNRLLIEPTGDMVIPGRIFAGPTKISAFSGASMNIHNNTNQGGIYIKTDNTLATYNTALAINLPGTRALTVLNTTLPEAGMMSFREFFTVWGDGSTHLGNNVQLGFNTAAIQDINTNININNAGLNNGIKFNTWNNAARLITVSNVNFGSSPFTVYGEGYVHIGKVLQVGFDATDVIQRNDILVNLNAINKMGLSSTTTHTSDGGYNSLITVDRSLTKALAVVNTSVSPAETFLVNGDGSTAIGSNYVPVGYKLAVHGKIIAEEVLIKLKASWPDYVFESSHKLMPLCELNEYIRNNKHLPNIPSAIEVKNEGLSISDIQVRQMEKIEELTLYLIEQNNRIEKLEAAIKAISK